MNELVEPVSVLLRRKRQAKWRERNKAQIAAKDRRYKFDNRDKIRARNKRWYVNNTAKYKATIARRRLKRRYGITPEDRAAMAIAQKNRCAICGDEFTDTPCLDHDHLTGKLRGLLCRGCNVVLGFINDDIAVLEAAINYLKSGGVL
jgi:hypothetical protein